MQRTIEEKPTHIIMTESDLSSEEPDSQFWNLGQFSLKECAISSSHPLPKLREEFGEEFPLSVTLGELSFRMERLLACGCHCLRVTDHLNPTWLIFGPDPVGRRVTIYQNPIRSMDEQIKDSERIRQIISKNGADSVMMLAAMKRTAEVPEGIKGAPVGTPLRAIIVLARDSRSYFMGIQQYREFNGKYYFEEPTIQETTDELFSGYKFPVPPERKERQRTKNRKKRKKRK